VAASCAEYVLKFRGRRASYAIRVEQGEQRSILRSREDFAGTSGEITTQHDAPGEEEFDAASAASATKACRAEQKPLNGPLTMPADREPTHAALVPFLEPRRRVLVKPCSLASCG
jgi:hypothetical protein